MFYSVFNGTLREKELVLCLKTEFSDRLGGDVLTSGKGNDRIIQGFAKIILILKYYNECKNENGHRFKGVWL